MPTDQTENCLNLNALNLTKLDLLNILIIKSSFHKWIIFMLKILILTEKFHEKQELNIFICIWYCGILIHLNGE